MTDIIRVRGFKNLGNTCYMNSALQALFSSNIFNNAILLYIQRNPNSVHKFSPLLMEYCRILVDLVDPSNDKMGTLSPSMFKEVLGKVKSSFGGFRQQDSHELMLSMMTDFVDNTKSTGIVNLIKRMCHGKYKQYICCDECRKVSESYSTFFDVQLPIPDVPNPDLESCFKKLAQYETLDGDNKWICSNCKKKVIAYRKMELHDVPEIAVFMFNRFIGGHKTNVPIQLYEFIELEGKKMRLISTINHYGTVHGGHYVAHVSREVNGKIRWYRADDSMITPINDSRFLNDPSVYVVIYQVVL